MPQDLPPLPPLLAFDAAARTGSFKLAAQALCLTPSAVSQQIKALEDAIGAALFERSPGAVKLSAAGREYAQVVAVALDTLRRGTLRLREKPHRTPLRLTVDPFVAQELLIPSLAQFARSHPQFEIILESESAVVDLRNAQLDAGLRCGVGPWPGLHHEIVATMEVTPVAAPALLARRPIRRPSDLSEHTLIQVQGTNDYWGETARILDFEVGERLTFNTFQETVQAAVHGMGVAFGIFPILDRMLLDHRLVAPLSVCWDQFPFQLVCRPEDVAMPGIVALRELLQQVFSNLQCKAPPCPKTDVAVPAHGQLLLRQLSQGPRAGAGLAGGEVAEPTPSTKPTSASRTPGKLDPA